MISFIVITIIVVGLSKVAFDLFLLYRDLSK